MIALAQGVLGNQLRWELKIEICELHEVRETYPLSTPPSSSIGMTHFRGPFGPITAVDMDLVHSSFATAAREEWRKEVILWNWPCQ